MHECTFVSRPLVEEDLPLVLELCLGNPLYYGFIGEKPTIESLAVELGGSCLLAVLLNKSGRLVILIEAVSWRPF